MKPKTLIALAAIIALTATVERAAAQPQVTNIVLSGVNQTNTVQIASFQYAKILTATDGDKSTFNGAYATSWGQLILGTSPPIAFNIPHTSQGETPVYLGAPNPNAYVNANSLAGLTLAGPASITVTTGGNSARNGPVLVTLEILPSAYSVTNTVTLGPGQGAAVNLEGSTNLINWTPTTNGIYTAQSAMFFRLQLTRLQ